MTNLRFPWAPCPECGSVEVYDTAADNAPTFRFECGECGHEWQTAGFAVSFGSPDSVEGNR